MQNAELPFLLLNISVSFPGKAIPVFLSDSAVFKMFTESLYQKYLAVIPWHCIYQSLSSLQTCEIKAEGGKRFLTLHKVKLEQAGEVLYQALNAVTAAILTVKGTVHHGTWYISPYAEFFISPYGARYK